MLGQCLISMFFSFLALSHLKVWFFSSLPSAVSVCVCIKVIIRLLHVHEYQIDKICISFAIERRSELFTQIQTQNLCLPAGIILEKIQWEQFFRRKHFLKDFCKICNYTTVSDNVCTQNEKHCRAGKRMKETMSSTLTFSPLLWNMTTFS